MMLYSYIIISPGCPGVKGINRKIPFSLSIENELTFSLTFTFLGLGVLIKAIGNAY